MGYITSTLNTANSSSFSTGTPTLEFTGVEDAGSDIRYELQIDNVNTFDSNEDLTVDDSNEDTLSTSVPFGYDDGNTSLSIIGEVFTSQGGVLQMVYLPGIYSDGSPMYNIVVKIYNWDDTTGLGSLLATSEDTDLIGLYYLNNYVYFNGTNKITLINGQKYFLSIESYGNVSSSFYNMGLSLTTFTNGGNAYINYNGDLMAMHLMYGSYDVNFNFEVLTGTRGGLINTISGTGSGFANVDTPADTDPFNSGDKCSYTVQGADILSNGTYYWRIRGKSVDGTNANGDNIYLQYTSAYSFTVSTGGTTTIENILLGNIEIDKLYLGSTEIKKAYLGDTLVYDI